MVVAGVHLESKGLTLTLSACLPAGSLQIDGRSTGLLLGLQNLLLGSLHSAATNAEDWRYIGQHALPLMLPTWVQFGESGMRECISGVDLELDLPDVEAFVTILGDSQTCGLLAFPACCFPVCSLASHSHLCTSSIAA